VAKTADRTILGCMNDMAHHSEAIVHRAGGLAAADLADINQALRRNILSARAYRQPIELVTERLALGGFDQFRQASGLGGPVDFARGIVRGG
jgi:hypothetical protein